MKRKDMQLGVLYAIVNNGVCRPGVIFDAKSEKIRARVWWTWPAPEGTNEIDYLDPDPQITDPVAKYDDRKNIKTSDVLGEWEPWAVAQKAERSATPR